jgi:hypothetical protein
VVRAAFVTIVLSLSRNARIAPERGSTNTPTSPPRSKYVSGSSGERSYWFCQVVAEQDGQVDGLERLGVRLGLHEQQKGDAIRDLGGDAVDALCEVRAADFHNVADIDAAAGFEDRLVGRRYRRRLTGFAVVRNAIQRVEHVVDIAEFDTRDGREYDAVVAFLTGGIRSRCIGCACGGISCSRQRTQTMCHVAERQVRARRLIDWCCACA